MTPRKRPYILISLSHSNCSSSRSAQSLHGMALSQGERRRANMKGFSLITWLKLRKVDSLYYISHQEDFYHTLVFNELCRLWQRALTVTLTVIHRAARTESPSHSFAMAHLCSVSLLLGCNHRSKAWILGANECP